MVEREVVITEGEYNALRSLESTVRYIDGTIDAADLQRTDWDALTLAYTRKRMLLSELYEMREAP